MLWFLQVTCYREKFNYLSLHLSVNNRQSNESIYYPVCSSVCPIYVFISESILGSVHSSFYLSNHPSIDLLIICVYSYIWPSIYTCTIHQSIYPTIYLSIHTYHFHLIPKNADDLEDMFLTYLALVDYNLLYLPNPRNNNNTINIWTDKLK